MHRPKPHGKTPNPKVKSKAKRRIAHHLWPRLVQGEVWSARDGIRQILMHYEDGLTEKEVSYLKARDEELAEMTEKLNKMYYRLKF